MTMVTSRPRSWKGGRKGRERRKKTEGRRRGEGEGKDHQERRERRRGRRGRPTTAIRPPPPIETGKKRLLDITK